MLRLTDTLNFQAQALTLRAERQRLIASNIANADTPGYQARELDFARALREATGGASDNATAALSLTHAAHVSAGSGARAQPHLLYVRPAQDNLDGNTVDLDRERAAAADNAVKYEATLRFINSHVRSLSEAMRSAQQG